jgi:hypothetical protein
VSTIRRTRPFDVAPTAEQHQLMVALDAWIKAEIAAGRGVEWATGTEEVAAMLAATHYGDATCDCGRLDVWSTNYAHRVVQRDEGWVAEYRCFACGKHYTAGWADAAELPAL